MQEKQMPGMKEPPATAFVAGGAPPAGPAWEHLLRATGWTLRPVALPADIPAAVADTGVADIFLLAANLPDLAEWIAAIRAWETGGDIPILLVGGPDIATEEALARGLDAGADDYLVLPTAPRLLVQRLRLLAERHRLARRVREMRAHLSASHVRQQQAETMRDALFYMIVHDMNNPLSVVSSFCELAREDLAAQPPTYTMIGENLRHVQMAVTEMQTLIRGILDLWRLEEGKMPVNPQALDLAALARDVVAECQTRAAHYSIQLQLEEPAGPVAAMADPELVRRMLQNLLANAIKHTLPDTRVVVTLARDRGQAQVRVTDSGPGIALEHQERIFDKFFQIPGDGVKKPYGIGLGLAFCRMAARAQGGEVRVSSDPGHGATFIVALPGTP